MSGGQRVGLAEARWVAADVAGFLEGGTERLEVAGSIRRNRPDVGDIELVAIPTLTNRPDGMWGSATDNGLTAGIDQAIAGRLLAPHPTDPKRGERYSKLIHSDSGLQVDIFSARLHTWGMVLLIRTGSRDYSARFVVDLRRRGLHASKGELHRGGLGCGAYVCEIVPTPEESDVYAAAGWPWVAPEDRR